MANPSWLTAAGLKHPNVNYKITISAGRWWLMPIILATQETEIRRLLFGQIVLETLSWKNPSQKRAGRVAQGIGPKFKLQFHQ
jgi:hypothetical protein